ncbi:MAG: CBS domain-containing protein [Thiotrichales bacterium]|nr:MAG: CBS domain-containing protein [Thiotrichales bacterium]
MTTRKIMTSRVITIRPADKVADAMVLMHKHHVRNLPVVDDGGVFIGLFGVRRLARMLLPQAAVDFSRFSVADLSFLPDEVTQMSERWHEVARKPVKSFLEKERKLLFCTPDTSFPRLLELIEQSKDSSLPVIVVEGNTRKLAGMVSAWDVLEGIIMQLLAETSGTGTDPAPDTGPDRNPQSNGQ